MASQCTACLGDGACQSYEGEGRNELGEECPTCNGYAVLSRKLTKYGDVYLGSVTTLVSSASAH